MAVYQGNLRALGALGLLAGASDAPVTSYTAKVPVLGDLYGDVSTSILKTAEKLTSKGWRAAARGIQTATGWFGGAEFGKMEVTLQKKGGAPFSAKEAEAAILSAAGSAGLKIAVVSQWATQVVSFVGEAPGTALSEKGRQQTADAFASAAKAAGDAADRAGKTIWGSIPMWAKVAGSGAIALFAVSQVATIAKAVRG